MTLPADPAPTTTYSDVVVVVVVVVLVLVVVAVPAVIDDADDEPPLAGNVTSGWMLQNEFLNQKNLLPRQGYLAAIFIVVIVIVVVIVKTKVEEDRPFFLLYDSFLGWVGGGDFWFL